MPGEATTGPEDKAVEPDKPGAKGFASSSGRFTIDREPRGGVNALGPALRRWRAQNRVKQDALASDLGVSQATLSRLENRKRLSDRREARRVAAVLEARPTTASDRALAPASVRFGHDNVSRSAEGTWR
ncbi:MAG: helix-turn-helix transcriptional regulator [Brevundimonas sp.]